jgi:thiamine biosynthesis protein ThiS
MRITLNNNPEIFDEEVLSIEGIIQKKNFTFKMLVTKLNGKVIIKNERTTTLVKDGDDLMVLHLVSGG